MKTKMGKERQIINNTNLEHIKKVKWYYGHDIWAGSAPFVSATWQTTNRVFITVMVMTVFSSQEGHSLIRMTMCAPHPTIDNNSKIGRATNHIILVLSSTSLWWDSHLSTGIVASCVFVIIGSQSDHVSESRVSLEEIKNVKLNTF